MAARSIGSGTISFGLVSIPVKLYPATSSRGVSFNLLHKKCGNRIKQQKYCPVCNEVVDWDQIVKGYEFAKDQYVQFSEEELKSVEGDASKLIDIAQFVPLPKVDPIYFQNTYYLGPDKGGEKPYRLLSESMAKANMVALAKFMLRSKENLVLIRAARDGLLLHTMYFADEVRDFSEISEKLASIKIRDEEQQLALRLIGELSDEEFEPERYEDEYRRRVLETVQNKVEGKEITAVEPEARRAQVIDLMEALKESLASKGGREKKPAVQAQRSRKRPEEAKKKARSGKR